MLAIVFFSFEDLKLQYDPYPVGLIKPLMDEGTYGEFVQRFPDRDLLTSHASAGRQGDKFTLSEKLDPKGYRRFIASDPVWSEFHRWVKSDAFIYGMLDALARQHVDLGFRRMSRTRRTAERVYGRLRGKRPAELSRLRSRFEFSALSAAGGHLRPHTDSPGKLVTVVVSILGEEGWDPSVGGGTDIDEPLLDAHKFNHVNGKAEFEQVRKVASFEYAPNQAVVFVKTHNSWHSVRPMTGENQNVLRRTLTINIEAVG